jgi:hypothetical protein
LVEIWEQRIPWLNTMHKATVPGYSSPHGIVVDYQRPSVDFDTCNNCPERTQYRTIGLTGISNEYYFQPNYDLGKINPAWPKVRLTDLRCNKAYDDARTKLFAVLAGSYEIGFGYDPEFFPLDLKQLPPFFKTTYTSSAGWTADGLAWEAHSPGNIRCFNSLYSYWAQMVNCRVRRSINDDGISVPLSVSPRLDLPAEIREQLTEDHLKLGCNPSKNIYGLSGNLGAAAQLPTRWAGGHMHVCIPKCYRENTLVVERCIRNIDAIAGVALVSMVGKFDDTERRRYYGQAGEYRMKPYGFEYRTPSNQMWCSSLWLYAFGEVMRMATKAALAGLSYEDLGFDTTEEEIIRTIQDNNVALAQAIVRRNLAVYNAIFSAKSNFDSNSFAIMNVLLGDSMAGSIGSRHRANSTSSLSSVFGTRSQLASIPAVSWPAQYNNAKLFSPKDN